MVGWKAVCQNNVVIWRFYQEINLVRGLEALLRVWLLRWSGYPSSEETVKDKAGL